MSVQEDLVARRNELEKARENILDQLYDTCQVMETVLEDPTSSNELKKYYTGLVDKMDEKLLIIEKQEEPILKLLTFTFTFQSEVYIFTPPSFTMSGMDTDVPHDITFRASSQSGEWESEKVFIALICGRQIRFESDEDCVYHEVSREGKFVAPVNDAVINMDFDGEREERKMTKAEFEAELARGIDMFENVTFTESLENFDAHGAYQLRFIGCKFDNFRKSFQFQRSLQSISFADCEITGDTAFAAFAHCHSMISIDVTGLDVSNVNNMAAMFAGCDRIDYSIDLSHFNTSKVTTMNGMFAGCFRLPELNLFNFDFTNVINTQVMFRSCINLKRIFVVAGLDLSSLEYTFNMFSNCESIVGLNGTTYDANHIDGEYARVDEEGKPGYFSIPPLM